MSTHKMTIKVNVVELMNEMANTCNSFQCAMGTRIALGCLERIAKRACELNDPALLAELQVLCLVEEEKVST